MGSTCSLLPDHQDFIFAIKKFRLRFLFVLFAVLIGSCFSTFAQQATIVGTVTDPSGAVIPNAKVTAKNEATGATVSTTTGGDGNYRFALLQPGQYTVIASASGFRTAQTEASVAVGTVATVNLKLPVGSETQTVEVTEAAPLLQTQNADISTTFNAQQISSLPNPGNDITFMGQLAPGSVINSTNSSNQAANGLFGYGNFSSFGLPAT